tara:strand:- start:1440 stop:3095 length:1656 start_codon:yes stop_codon:yes gene_type:complete
MNMKSWLMENKKVSAQVREALKKKVQEHNEKYGDDPKRRVTLRMLEACFRRGVGAYNTNPGSVRPSVRRSGGADRWAYARVNAFLYAVRNLRFRSGKFDLDLLPASHPLSSKKNYKGLYDDLNFTIPKGAKEEAKRGLEWVKEHGRGGTSVGRNSARYILNNTTAGPEKTRHIAKYFPRHEVDKRAEGWRPGEKGYPSNGRIAWALWGGEAGKTWSQKLVRAMNKRDEKATSAFELIKRRNKLRENSWDIRLNKFRGEDKKDILYKEHDKLLTQWEKILQELYFNLLQKQDRQIQKQLKRYFPTEAGINSIIELTIDENTKSWSSEVYDYNISLVNDYAFYQVDLLLPTEKEMPHSIPIITKQTKKEIIEQGLFYRLVSVDDFPIQNVRSNKEVAEYITAQVDNLLPALSQTSKNRFNKTFTKVLQEALDLGYTGSQLQNYVANNVKKLLSKSNLTRALTIARTEGNKLANYGRQVGAKSTNLVYTKEWISQRDGKVRDAHIVLDGTEINEDSLFDYNGYRLDYPGDSSLGATPDLTVNCRCFLSYHEKRV